MMSSMVTPAGARRAVTSSPGASSAKPRTSNPQATFDTVAGANAVIESIAAHILPVTTVNAELAQAAEPRRSAVSTLIVRGSSTVALANGRDQVLVEGALEVVGRIEAPVAAGGRGRHRGWARNDDPPPLCVDLVADGRVAERRDDFLADLRSRRIERGEIIGAARQAMTRRGGERQQRIHPVGHRHERDRR